MLLEENDIRKIVLECVRKILNEGISDITYHFTSIHSCIKILTKNAFFLTLSSNQSDSYDNKRLFYLSTQRGRNKNLGYAGHYSGCVRIQLNGNVLMQNYAGKPVDYWGASMGKQSYYKQDRDYPQSFATKQTHHNFEMEDRLLSYQSVIENANKYITRIDVFIDPRLYKKEVAKKNNNTEYLNRIEQEIESDKYQAMAVYVLAKRLGIPVFVYTSLNDFNFMTENNINTEMEEIYHNDHNIKQEPDYRDKPLYKSAMKFKDRTTKLNIITALMSICFNTNYVRYIKGELPQETMQEIALVLKKFNLQRYTSSVLDELKKLRESFSELCHLLSSTVNLPLRKLNTEMDDDEANNIMMLGAYVLKKYNCTNFDSLAKQKP